MPTPSALPPGGPVPEYPQSLVPVGHVEPAPRRVRAFLGGRTVLNTERARYVWEWPHYPQYYVPRDDVDASLLVDARAAEDSSRGTARRHGLQVGEASRPGAALVYGADAPEALRDTVRFEWSAVDFTHLAPSPTVTACPYKGRTSAYWSAETGSAVHPDIAWSYDFPTRELSPIAGLVAFYDEKVDVVVDGRRRPRPRTPF